MKKIETPKLTLIAHVASEVGNKVILKGWVYNKRSSGKIAFLQLRDGSGFIQAVYVKSKDNKANFNLTKSLTLESSVKIVGLVKADKRAPSGYELEVESLIILQIAADNYPIGKKEHGINFLLDHRHLWLRSQRQQAILKIRDNIIHSIYDFYRQEQFVKIDTPIFTPSACEGTTTLFAVDYFGQKSYLSQSGQLYLEAAIYTFGKVYDFQPVFRAEKSKTRRHLIEFWMNNAEMAFVNHQENMAIQEQLIVFVVKNVLDQCRVELALLGRDIDLLKNITSPFPVLTYYKAVKQINKLGGKMRLGHDFGAEDEAILSKHYQKPVFVEQYPIKVKAFYMKKHPDDKSLGLNNDLLAPEGYGEIIGGSQREDDYDELFREIKKHKLDPKAFAWYLDLRKYGSVEHSGFGIGLERLVTWICGLKHVREAIPFPRLLNRNYP